MYITTFFNLKKVREKKKIIKDNFSYLNSLEKNIKKKGLDNLVIKENKFKSLCNRFKEKNIKKKEDKKKFNFKNIKFNNLNKVKLFNDSDSFNVFDGIKFIVLLIIILNIVPFFSLNGNILHFASNVYVTKNRDINIADINNIYPVFNPSSYILNKKVIVKEENKIIDKKEEVKEEKKDNFVFNASLNNSKEIIDSVFNDKKDVSVFNFNKDLNVDIKKASNRDVISFDNVSIYDYSSRNDIDFKELYNRKINLTKKSDKILLYNTHASESYKNSDGYKFEYSGTYRSRDEKYNMLGIAKEFQSNLISKNINVIHNTTGHDYYKYTGSYGKSRETIKNEFKNHGNFGIIMDIHRDACANLDYAPKVNIKGVNVSKIMLVLGVGNKSNRNKYADDNIALAIKIQNLGEKIYPRFI